MEDEDDLEKWESKELTSSDLKILLTNWLAKSANKTLQEIPNGNILSTLALSLLQQTWRSQTHSS
jgi:hypothetical protein